MKIRKAVILAGGSGTRLRPLTLATNKHLLPLYDKPVIYHEHIDNFVRALGSGEHWKLKSGNESQIQISYGIQNKPGGIAQGLYIARDYIGDEPCILYLGDNYIEDNLGPHLKNCKGGAMIFLKKVADPERFGVATLGKN